MFIHRHWYLFLGLALGGVVAAVIFGPMFKARAASSVSVRHYLRPAPLTALAVGLVAGAATVSVLEGDALIFFLIATFVLCPILSWVLMFENDAVRFAGWFRFGGVLQPVPERMAKPVQRSWVFTSLFFVVGLVGGACVRLLTLASA